MSRSSRIAPALALFLTVEVVFIATTCPSYFLVDCPELNAAAAEWGVPHPPGYPLYTMLGGLAIRLLPFADAGFCMNLMTGFFAALAAVVVFTALRRLSRSVWVATAGAAALAFSATVWSMATVSEVYTLELLLLAGFLACIARVFEPDASDARKWLRRAALCFGFALAHRNVTALFAPILLYAAVRTHGRQLLRPRHLSILAALVLSPLCVYLYLPLAAARNPVINIGEPTSLGALWDITSGKAFKHLLLESGDARFYLRRLTLYLSYLPRELGLLLLLLPLGILRLARDHRPLLWCLVYVLAVNVAWSMAYNIYDIQTHMLPSLLAMSMLGAMGVLWAAERVRESSLARLTAIGLALGNTGLLLFLNCAENDQRQNTIGPRFAHDVFATVEEKSAILSRISPTTYVLWAASILDHVKPDVANIDPSFASDWYSKQLRRRYGESLGLDIPENPPSRDHFAFEFIARNAARLPIYLGSSLAVFFDDPQATRELRSRWTSVPVGMLHLVIPSTELDRRRDALVDRNLEYWEKTLPKFEAMPVITEDFETISLKLRYAQGLFDAAQFCMDSGRNAEARRFLRQFVTLDTDARTRQYNAYWHDHGYDDRDAPAYGEIGRRMLRDLRDEPDRTAAKPPDFATRYAEAVDLFRAGKFAAARVRLRELASSRPESVEVKFSLACIAAKKNESAGAIALLEKVIATDAQFEDAYPMLADLYIKTKQLDRAAATVDRFLQVRPGHPAALNFKARIDKLRN